MLSISAYDLLNVIVEGEVTVHVLRLGLISRGFSDVTASEALLDYLIELCEAQAITFLAETTYGGGTYGESSVGGSTAELLAAWRKIFGTFGPAEAEVSTSTISFDTTEKGAEIATSTDYDLYLPFLRAWCDWPDD